jgi:Ni2+-binding GTPase involved in maturation of urease and hydrogenase
MTLDTNNASPRFIMIGGFLGAGKTTTISKLAQHFQSLGKRVVIVTNDQAADLVDTLLLRSQGFNVGEVAGSCFCCNFNELTHTIESLACDQRPDVILAEPVGSCTDLVATVIRPLEQVYDVKFDISPYGVIIKPSHGFKILGGSAGGFSPKAEYIFRKQLEESDFIIINRIDELTAEQTEKLIAVLAAEYPGVPVVQMSARTGLGFGALCDQLDRPLEQDRRQMDVDYDVYAEGEAELGWLNCQVNISSVEPVAMDAILMTILSGLYQRFVDITAEIAHVKLIAMSDQGHAVGNVVSNVGAPVLSLASEAMATEIHMVINARVAIDPDHLAEIVRAVLGEAAASSATSVDISTIQYFRPGRPVPTHRIATG